VIERNYDISFISHLALREKQIQQNYRPVIAVHKWFARRPGTLFRGLILSEFSEKPLHDCFYLPNAFPDKKIADPFMGGGTPIMEANRLSCDVQGYDINPMAFWIVKQEIDHLNVDKYLSSGEDLRRTLEKKFGPLYRTKCDICGNPEAHVKYYLWVKTIDCEECGRNIDLFPGSLVAQNVRHPRNVFVCCSCGHLHESDDRQHPGRCPKCHVPFTISGPAQRGSCACPVCGRQNKFMVARSKPPSHRLFALEYHCFKCRPSHKGRFFKKPDKSDLKNCEFAVEQVRKPKFKFVPSDEIPSGDETNRLLRWGYRHYSEMFNARQLLLLETSAELISECKDERVRNALATNLSDLLRYQNMLCRYDTMALKSLDIFSVHGFPVGLIQCESNFLGIYDKDRNVNIGSGGWSNIILKYATAKKYCNKPFEIRHNGMGESKVFIDGEWIGDRLNGNGTSPSKNVHLSCTDATVHNIRKGSLDAVFTDPPYFGNVQYAELMDFCYVWLRKLLGEGTPGFSQTTTRTDNELTGNETMGRDLAHFTEGISSTFSKMAYALKPGSPLAFTYHHNRIEAYYAVGVALLDSSLTCSATLPCPAEMGGSIHISNTSSSIIDTVFVARSTGTVPRSWVPLNVDGLYALIASDVTALRSAGVQPTAGDVRCILYGHLTRLSIWNLRKNWVKNEPIQDKLTKFGQSMSQFGNTLDILNRISEGLPKRQPENFYIREESATYNDKQNDEIPF
jgi:putative DNA methylase